MTKNVASTTGFSSPDNGGDRLIPIRTAADLLAVSVRTVYRLLASHEFPKPRRIGRKVLFRHSDILAYMQGGVA